MELFAKEGLSHIASAVGFPLYMDKSTKQCRRVDVARICMEVSSDDLLPSSSIEVDIESFGQIEVEVLYPFEPDTCSICKSFGHTDKGCAKRKKV